MSKATNRHVRISIVITDDAERSATYDTADQIIVFEGEFYPRDALLVSQLVEHVKAEQKHGPQNAVGAERPVSKEEKGFKERLAVRRALEAVREKAGNPS